MENLIVVFLASIFLFIIVMLIKYGRVGFRLLLIKIGMIDKNDERSYTELIAYGIGKLIGRIFYKKK